MYEARVFDRTVEGRSSWGNPRVIELKNSFYPKFIYIKSKTTGILRAFKRREFDADNYYHKSKYHEKYDQETGASYAEYEEVDKDILIIESE